jgi:membrane dipeptidase
MPDAAEGPRDLTAGPDAIALTRDSFVFDCLSLNYVLEDQYAERCREGGVDAMNLTVAAEQQTWDDTLRLTDEFLTRIARSPYLQQATDSAGIEAARRNGKTAVILGSQGASMLDDKPWRVRVLHRLGFRYCGIAYTGATMFGDGCGETRDAGVSFLGRELIEEMNDVDMILDLSHAGHRTRAEATELAKWPVCTHSNAYSVLANDRNTKDETIKAIVAKGGMVGLCGLPRSVSPDGRPTLKQMVEHARHIVGLVGHEKLGLGFDFVEGWVEATKAGRMSHKPPKWRVLRPDIFGGVEDFFNDTYPIGMHSIRLLPNLTQAFLDEGWSREQVQAVLGGNWLRHFKAACG